MPALPPILPNHTHALEDLLAVATPPAPADFDMFWQSAYAQALAHDTDIVVAESEQQHKKWRVLDVHFRSTGGVVIWGWLLLPKKSAPQRAFVVGHGYGGRGEPDFDLPFPDAALFFPCFRGLSRSYAPPISQDPYWHIRHDIDKKDQYVLRGCVEDIWLSVSVLEYCYPEVTGRIGFLGISFSGGLGAFAVAQDKRIARAHLNVPTFGHHRLRLRAPTRGSGESLQHFFRQHPRKLLRTLAYYDAANAAERITQPMHYALALRDAVVTPLGQFAVYNQTRSEKCLCVLDAGHEEYANQKQQQRKLVKELEAFFCEM